MGVWENIAKEIVRQAEPLIPKYLPDLKAAMKEACLEALKEFFAKGQKPEYTAPAVEFPQPSTSDSFVIADLDRIPDMMRAAGFQHPNDNALYYALAFIYAFGPDHTMPDDGAGSLAGFNADHGLRASIHQWFDKIVRDAAGKLIVDRAKSVTIIANDGPDRCGFRLGPAIRDRLLELGARPGQINMGVIFNP